MYSSPYPPPAGGKKFSGWPDSSCMDSAPTESTNTLSLQEEHTICIEILSPKSSLAELEGGLPRNRPSFPWLGRRGVVAQPDNSFVDPCGPTPRFSNFVIVCIIENIFCLGTIRPVTECLTPWPIGRRKPAGAKVGHLRTMVFELRYQTETRRMTAQVSADRAVLFGPRLAIWVLFSYTA